MTSPSRYEVIGLDIETSEPNERGANVPAREPGKRNAPRVVLPPRRERLHARPSEAQPRLVHVYGLEDLDASLPLVPLAARRALDRAGIKVGLEAWTMLALETRQAITLEGSRDLVDSGRVRELAAPVPSAPHDAWPEPSSEEIPRGIADALPALTLSTWRSLRALDRWVVSSFLRREKHDALRSLARELARAELTPRRREE